MNTTSNEPSMLVLMLDVIGKFLMPITFAIVAATLIGVTWAGASTPEHPRNAEITIGFATGTPSK